MTAGDVDELRQNAAGMLSFLVQSKLLFVQRARGAHQAVLAVVTRALSAMLFAVSVRVGVTLRPIW